MRAPLKITSLCLPEQVSIRDTAAPLPLYNRLQVLFLRKHNQQDSHYWTILS